MEKFKNWLMANVTLKNYKKKEETLNWITHFIGAVLSFAALIIVLINYKSDIFVSSLIYVISMFFLYSASAFYHFTSHPIIKRIGRMIDHVNIYILIAGTYTPILMFVNTPFTNYLLLAVWLLAGLGIFITLAFWEKWKVLHITTYILLGWIIVFFGNRIFPVFIEEGFGDMIRYCIYGGVTYTVGVIAYAIKKIPYNHAIWHLFVLAGSGIFFMGIYLFLL